MRSAMRGILPEEIRLRKDKIGFDTPEAQWMNEIKTELKNYISSDLGPYVKVGRLLADWDEIFSRLYTSETSRIWRIINFAVWRKVFKI